MHSLVVEVAISLSPCQLLSSSPVVLPNAPPVTAIDPFRSLLDHSSSSLALLEVGGRERLSQCCCVMTCSQVPTATLGGPLTKSRVRAPPSICRISCNSRGVWSPPTPIFLNALNMIEQPRGSSGRGREIERHFEGCSTMCLLTIVAAGMHAITSSRSSGSVSQDAVLCGLCTLRAHKHGGRGRRTGGSPGLASAPHRR